MRNLLLLSLLVAGTASVAAQTPPAGPAPTAPTTPATPGGGARAAQPPTGARGAGTRGAQPTTARGAQAATTGRSGVAMTVTDMRGATLSGVKVELTGPAERRGETGPGGQLNFSGLPAGTYRLHFSGDAVTAFEREVALTAGKTASFDISLDPAPPPREIVREVAAPTPSAPPPPAVGPAGSPQLMSLYDMAEKELRQKQPRPEVLVACSGNLRSTLVFLANRDQPQRLYDSAEASYYVLGGDAVFHVGGKDTTLAAGGYVAVPRGVPFAITRRGNKSVTLLALLSGAACEEAK